MKTDPDASLLMVAVSLATVMAATQPPVWLSAVGLMAIAWTVLLVLARLSDHQQVRP